MEKINKKCQVFTPRKIVIEILDQVGYKKDLFGKTVYENSCGDGNFLVEIVERYIIDCKNKRMENSDICKGLESDIYGAEIDKSQKIKCYKKLNAISAKYSIGKVKWNIMQKDVLRMPIIKKFDYIIGNPPYITYSDLDKETREFIRSNFYVCEDGKPDYYYAFIELSLKSLNKEGKLAYLVPNNFFKTRFGEKLREYIRPYLTELYNYTTEKLFERKLTSSTVIICEGENHTKSVKYIDKVKSTTYFIDKHDLTGKWVFNNKTNHSTISTMQRFDKDFIALNTIATLLNDVFIIQVKDNKINEKYLIYNNYKIEKEVLREAFSPRSIYYNRTEYIIFPYKYNFEGKLTKYGEEEFNNLFPEAYKYLCSKRDELDKRDKDKSAQWFEFGRSQALQHLHQRKLLLSTIITGKMRIYDLDTEAIPYSGIFIIPRVNANLELAKDILNSDEFLSYIKDIGINANGRSIRISARDINNYYYDLNKL